MPTNKSQQWYVRSGERVHGPMLASLVEGFVQKQGLAGKVHVSSDRASWCPLHIWVNSTLEKESSPASPSAEYSLAEPRGACPFPVIRGRWRWRKVEIFAAYQDGWVTGRFNHRSVDIGEEHFGLNGRAIMRSTLERFQTGSWADIESISEEVPSAQRASRPNSRITFNHKDGSHSKFQLQTDQIGGLREVFATTIGDRFYIQRQKCTWKPLILLTAGAISACLAALAYYASSTNEQPKQPDHNFSELSFALMLLALLLAWMGYRRLGSGRGTANLSSWKRFEDAQLQAQRTKESLWDATGPGTARLTPLRSSKLGLALKLLGLIYWLIALSPLSDPFFEYIRDRIGGISFLLPLIWAPPVVLLHWGHSLCQSGYDRGQSGDTRKPIVYLRAFSSDRATSLQPRGVLAAWCGLASKSSYRSEVQPLAKQISTPRLVELANPIRILRMFTGHCVDTSEESITQHFKDYGPVVAIGRPGEAIATPGAQRLYVNNSEWKEAVLNLLGEAQVVVIQPGTTPGVAWELERVRDLTRPNSLLFCLASYERDPERYEECRALVKRSLGVDLPRSVPFHRRLCFVWFDQNWKPAMQGISLKSPLMWPFSGDAVNLRNTLTPFVQGMHGGEREEPRPVRHFSRFGWRTWLASGLALLIAASPPIAIHYCYQRIREAAATTNIALELLNSRWVKQKGTITRYSVSMPTRLKSNASRASPNESLYSSPDGRFKLTLFEYSERFNMSTLSSDRMQYYHSEGTIAEIKTPSGPWLPDSTWASSELELVVSGVKLVELCRGKSTDNGTVLAVIKIYPGSDTIEYRRLANRILTSLSL